MQQAWNVAVEGNIGVGKSTVLPSLAAALGDDWQVLSERVDEDPEFQKRLKDFYEDPNKQVQLQSWITQRRKHDFNQMDGTENYVLERSFLGELVFCHANLLSHECPKGSFITYYFDIIEAAKQCKYDAVVYLKASPKACYERIIGRSRGAEDAIKFEYIDYLHRCYEAHLPEVARSLEIPLVTVDWENFGDSADIAAELQQYLKQNTEVTKAA